MRPEGGTVQSRTAPMRAHSCGDVPVNWFWPTINQGLVSPVVWLVFQDIGQDHSLVPEEDMTQDFCGQLIGRGDGMVALDPELE